jgi:hypothetical protein
LGFEGKISWALNMFKLPNFRIFQLWKLKNIYIYNFKASCGSQETTIMSPAVCLSHRLTPRIIQPKNCTPNPAWMQMCFPPSRVDPTNEFPEIYVSKIIYDKFIETYYCSVYIYIYIYIYISHETYIGIYFWGKGIHFYSMICFFSKHWKEILIHMKGKERVRTYTWDSELECITIWSLAWIRVWKWQELSKTVAQKYMMTWLIVFMHLDFFMRKPVFFFWGIFSSTCIMIREWAILPWF